MKNTNELPEGYHIPNYKKVPSGYRKVQKNEVAERGDVCLGKDRRGVLLMPMAGHEKVLQESLGKEYWTSRPYPKVPN